ncbi:LGFP repeat-containing protein [Dactylosporangium sp. NPDC000521]|uniref:LGFP repeat-containing protein n=1 Tax=Dactylosporangium sp. NPDC000521 TaxID=3363975 RepID=UPI0036863264
MAGDDAHRGPFGVDILGAPSGRARPVGPSRWGTAGTAQPFEGGLVVEVSGRPPLLISGRLLRLYERCRGTLGFPLTGALRTVTALPGEPLLGHDYQLFEGPGAACRTAGLPACGAIGVAADGAAAAVAVSGPIWAGYCEAGGFDGRLGFPVDAARVRAARALQEFQGGVLLWSEEHGAHTVSGAIWDRIGGGPGLDEVGWPVAGQRPSPDDPFAYQQEFEHGIATVRDGIARFWRS